MSPLHPIVHEKFRRAFGAPKRTEGKDHHWSLRSKANIAGINVLVNGSADEPVVWVFDPHDGDDGVLHQRIRDESDVDAMIKKIEDRLKNAGGREA